MELLLDAHTLIWFSENDSKLSNLSRETIEFPDNVAYVSMATFWELAIKLSIGKLKLTNSLSSIITEIQANGFYLLPILPTHILQIETLPFLHRDPFDRILIAQALTEGLTLVSNEVLFDQYGIRRIW